VISGPSGAGKTSVCRALRQDGQVEWSVSATTRKMRKGEIDGVDYHFLSEADFVRRRERGEFLEWASYNGSLYGTLEAPMHEALRRGKIFLLEIEVQGTQKLREKAVPGLYIFIVPPSLEVLRERLILRSTNHADRHRPPARDRPPGAREPSALRQGRRQRRASAHDRRSGAAGRSHVSHVLLGVGGGIAAYKVAFLASRLVQAGHRVRVAMTAKAQEFVGALTFEGLVGSKAILTSTQVDADGSAPHIVATKQADVLVVAPASADLIAKLAAGAADDAVCLAALVCRCPRIVVPAMNDAMWESRAVQRNLARLRELEFEVLGPVVGRLAEGYEAIGRMVEPDAILARLTELLSAGKGPARRRKR
jgi:phosphopantothenoylcysteine decarboxylase/phosphopantothenate--cysteine ligase